MFFRRSLGLIICSLIAFAYLAAFPRCDAKYWFSSAKHALQRVTTCRLGCCLHVAQLHKRTFSELKRAPAAPDFTFSCEGCRREIFLLYRSSWLREWRQCTNLLRSVITAVSASPKKRLNTREHCTCHRAEPTHGTVSWRYLHSFKNHKTKLLFFKKFYIHFETNCPFSNWPAFFLSFYFRPVIITDCVPNWEAFTKWNVAYFRKHFAKDIVSMKAVMVRRSASGLFDYRPILHLSKRQCTFFK